MQWFPDYPLTQLAIKDGYITEEDANVEKLIETTTNDWAYVPNLMLTDKKIRITNVIWLVVWGHVNYEIARYGVFNNSIGAKLCLYYLNIKAVLYGKVVGVGGLRSRSRLIGWGITAIGLVFRGDLKGLFYKVVELIKKGYHKYHYRRNKSDYNQGPRQSGYHKMFD